MSPRTSDLLGDGLDQPLFEAEASTRRRRPRKPGLAAYSGPRTTCHPCLIAVEQGRVLSFPRAPGSWSLLTPAGREWVLCTLHKDEYERGVLTLEGGQG